MEPRKEESRKVSEPRKEDKKRFQIVKLEERIAPRIGGHYRYHYPGWYKHGHTAPPGQEP